MNSAALIAPYRKKVQRVFMHRSRLVMWLLGLGSVITVFLIYFGLYKFLEYIGKASEIGDAMGLFLGSLIISKLLEMLFLTLFFMLLFSSIIAALSAFYLNEELPTLISSPLPISLIFRSRFLLMTIESSWMVLVFFLPAFYAFATALNADIWAYLIFPVFLGIFVMLPNLFGAFLSLSLGAFFPVRQMKKIFQFLSILVLTGLIFFIRSLEAEKLLNPKHFADISQYLLSLEIPLIVYSPSSWLHRASMTLFHNNTLLAFEQILPLAGAVLIGFVLLNIFAAKTYRVSWQKSCEALDNQVLGLEWLRKAITFPLRFTPDTFRVISGKEVTAFLRDPAFFSQIFMIGAIVLIYGYNLSILPLKDVPRLYSEGMNNMLVYLNGPFIGFIVASIAMRFVFPSISMEGRAFWALKSSPVPSRSILLTKLIIYLIPMLIIGVALCVVTNSVFRITNQLLVVLSFFNVILITTVITGLAVSVGTVYADFSADSPLKISSSYGGFIYMLLSGLYIINLLILEIYPIYRYSFRSFYAFTGSNSWLPIAAGFLFLLAATAMWIYIPFKKGLETIDDYEPD